MTKKTKQIDHHCGNCCWFKFEDTDGDGTCVKHYWDINKGGEDPMLTRCDKKACKEYVSEEEKRHHLAVLLQANRYRRDNNVPAIYRMPNPTEFGKAIDFVCEYVKIYERL